MIDAGRFTIAPDHPALPGHFPGDPVVPGCVLLDHALATACSAIAGEGEAAVAAVPRVKFLRAVRPGDEVAIVAERRGQRLSFRGLVAGERVLDGQCEIR